MIAYLFCANHTVIQYYKNRTPAFHRYCTNVLSFEIQLIEELKIRVYKVCKNAQEVFTSFSLLLNHLFIRQNHLALAVYNCDKRSVHGWMKYHLLWIHVFYSPNNVTMNYYSTIPVTQSSSVNIFFIAITTPRGKMVKIPISSEVCVYFYKFDKQVRYGNYKNVQRAGVDNT